MNTWKVNKIMVKFRTFSKIIYKKHKRKKKTAHKDFVQLLRKCFGFNGYIIFGLKKQI